MRKKKGICRCKRGAASHESRKESFLHGRGKKSGPSRERGASCRGGSSTSRERGKNVASTQGDQVLFSEKEDFRQKWLEYSAYHLEGEVLYEGELSIVRRGTANAVRVSEQPYTPKGKKCKSKSKRRFDQLKENQRK